MGIFVYQLYDRLPGCKRERSGEKWVVFFVGSFFSVGRCIVFLVAGGL